MGRRNNPIEVQGEYNVKINKPWVRGIGKKKIRSSL